MNPIVDTTSVGRHARVVPAFLAMSIQRPLDSWVGVIRPHELLRWERKGDLTESACRDMRQVIVKRIRVKAEAIWAQRVNVRLVEGWRESLTSSDRKRVELLDLSDEKPLEVWTLREVKEALHLPLEQTLGILAKLEAVYWRPSTAPRPSRSDQQFRHESSVPVSDGLREQAEAVLRLSWVGKVTRHDLRFGFAGEGAFGEWLRKQMAGSSVPSSLPDLLQRLVVADKLTAEDEAKELAIAAGKECAPKSDGDGTLKKWVSMLMQRYISRRGAGRTLQEVGDDFGITRERVRQVCEAFEELFAEVDAATPALDRALMAASRVAPCEVDELDEQLRRFIGENAGIEALVAWATMLGQTNLPVLCERIRTKARGSLVDITMVQKPNAPAWVEPMIRHVIRDSSMFGCTNVLRIAGRLALKEGVAPGQEAIEMALEASAGFRWIDKETGWFTLGDNSNCSAAMRVRKIIAVAHSTVGADEITAALASDDVWMYRESTSLGLATPPVHVLRELLAGWPWLKVVQKGRFAAAEGFEPNGVLTGTEQACIDVITSHDGVACRFELKDVVLGQLGLTDVMLAAVLGSSPIFERLEHGLYRIIGRRVGDGAINAARRRLRERSGQGVTPPDARPNEFYIRVTEASLKNEQYHVPTRFVPSLAGKQHQLSFEHGSLVGEARVTQSGALSGINRYFPKAAPGDLLGIEVLSQGLRVRYCPQQVDPN